MENKYKDHSEMFADIGPLKLRASIFPINAIGDIRYCTVEEMYQHFKARLTEELDLTNQAIDAPAPYIDITDICPSTKSHPYPALKSLKSIDFSNWPDIPNKQTMADWLKSRSKKKLANTQSAMDLTNREINKAREHGFTAQHCILLSASKGWGGFKYEWFENEVGCQPGTDKVQERFEQIADRSWADGL